MSGTWTREELRRVGDAAELQIASRRDDGSLRPYVTIWTVRAGDSIYVRSAYGSANRWFRHATASGSGRIRAGGIERDVTFTTASQLDERTLAAVDAAYHAKYDRYGPQIVGTVTGAHAAPVTLRLDPATPPDHSTDSGRTDALHDTGKRRPEDQPHRAGLHELRRHLARLQRLGPG